MNEATTTLTRTDAGEVVEDAVREFLLPQFVPEVLLRVELGRVGGQAQQPDVGGHCKILGHVRACAVHHHDDEVAPMGDADLRQELTHAVGVHLGRDHPVELSLDRADGAVDIDELALVAVAHRGPLGLGRPASPDSNHATEASFVLEHQSDPASARDPSFEAGSQHLGEFFFHASCSAGSLLGCRVSAATLRQPWRARSR